MKKDVEKRGESNFAEGAISILAVIKNESRPVLRILLSKQVKKDDRTILNVLSIAKKKKIPVQMADETFFQEVTTGHTHGGIIAEVR